MTNAYNTITHFIIEQQRIHGGGGNLTLLLNDIVTSCKAISNQVNHGALVGALGSLDSENIQGEVQKKLDVLSNDIFLGNCEHGGHLMAMASEEMDDIYVIPEEYPKGKYLLLFDPLDGSSNIDVNVSVGTIFSILRAPDGKIGASVDDFMQPGTRQICAGYALYGPSTMLVLTTGQGVNGFTLDQNVGEFMLTHPNLNIPEETSEFAINASRARSWEAPVKRYVDECLAGEDGPRKRNFNMRWIASMVAEVHRILIRGGVFMYPMDEKIRDQGGRLRLLYEANPMAMIIEQANGLASTGYERIVELTPGKLHQRVPVILGSRNEVQRIIDYHQQGAEKSSP